MTEQQFCYWLQGFAELCGDCPPTPEQWKSIREHLATVFKKVTPPVDLGKTAREIAKEWESNRMLPAKPFEWPPVSSYPLQYPLPGTPPTTIC